MIQLSKQEAMREQTSHIPYGRARRWWSNVEKESRPSPISIFVTQKAYVRICAHAGSDLENEVGGWMVGKQRTDPTTGKSFIVIEAILPAVHTRYGSAYLTFTQDSQVAMHGIMEERFPGKDLVGWYHTHPKMGVFLSKYDHWLHENFFRQPWQVALVVEPYTNVAGFFTWDSDGQLGTRYYHGFHEINNGQNRSVVHWRNMFSKPMSEVEGG